MNKKIHDIRANALRIIENETDRLTDEIQSYIYELCTENLDGIYDENEYEIPVIPSQINDRLNHICGCFSVFSSITPEANMIYDTGYISDMECPGFEEGNTYTHCYEVFSKGFETYEEALEAAITVASYANYLATVNKDSFLEKIGCKKLSDYSNKRTEKDNAIETDRKDIIETAELFKIIIK